MAYRDRKGKKQFDEIIHYWPFGIPLEDALRNMDAARNRKVDDPLKPVGLTERFLGYFKTDEGRAWLQTKGVPAYDDIWVYNDVWQIVTGYAGNEPDSAFPCVITYENINTLRSGKVYDAHVITRDGTLHIDGSAFDIGRCASFREHGSRFMKGSTQSL